MLEMVAVGDLMLAEDPLSFSFGAGSMIRKLGIGPFLAPVREFMSPADVVFGNLEAPLRVGSPGNEKSLVPFGADPAVLDGLAGAGFNVLSVANNHIMEQGREGFEQTVKGLRDHGIQPVGIEDTPVILSAHGLRVAMLGFSLADDPHTEVPYARVRSMEDITAKVRRIRDAADLIVVSLHWGQEYVPVPSPQQVSMGRLLIDGGVDLVLGTHPHVLQGWERYRGGLIVYSLGNFVFPMEYISGTDVGIITRIIFSGKGQWQVTGIPVRSNPRSHAPEIPDTRESQDILGHLRELQELLEGCSVDEYARRIGDYDSLLRLNKRQALRAMKVHVLRNFYRYPPRHLLHLLQGYIGKRVANAAI